MDFFERLLVLLDLDCSLWSSVEASGSPVSGNGNKCIFMIQGENWHYEIPATFFFYTRQDWNQIMCAFFYFHGEEAEVTTHSFFSR